MMVELPIIHETPLPTLPSVLSNLNVKQISFINLPWDFVIKIETVYFAFEEYIKLHKMPPTIRATIVYADSDNFILPCFITGAGMVQKTLSYNMKLLLHTRLTRSSIPVEWPVLLEELFHAFYNIQDEFEVKVRVLDVISRYFGEVTFDSLYDTFDNPAGEKLYSLAVEDVEQNVYSS